MFRVIKTEGTARQGEFTCPHGVVQTPVFMNVGTQGAIKGALSAFDLKDIGCQIELSNTYHLHLRPGDDVVRQMGGLHKFMDWDGPMLTDSGGFQVFSLSGLRKITEEGVTFASHIDGRRIFMGPEESMRIQSNLGSDIAMAFDECVENPAPYDYVKQSCERTLRWLKRWAAPVTGGEAIAAFNQLGNRLGLDRRPRLLVCQGLKAPMLAGLLRPAILLPQEGVSGETLGFSLLHELTHYRRRDVWLKTLALWVNALHWFNPLMWYMVRLVERDTELACDEDALRRVLEELNEQGFLLDEDGWEV